MIPIDPRSSAKVAEIKPGKTVRLAGPGHCLTHKYWDDIRRAANIDPMVSCETDGNTLIITRKSND